MPFDSTGFDNYAAEYEAALEQGISVSGENKDYFARRRIEWLADCLARLNEKPKRILDFGCGIGSAARFLVELGMDTFVVGLDISSKSVEVAKQLNPVARTEFLLLQQYRPNAEIDLAFSNGVFHHIPIARRADAVNYIYRSLRPGGLFAFWENNPWNPGTRYVMSRIPFDRDALPVTAAQARRFLNGGGFDILRTDFLFVFPRMLRAFRGVEPALSCFPLGAQYQILCRKSGLEQD